MLTIINVVFKEFMKKRAFSSQVKNYIYHLNEQSLRSLSQSNSPFSLDQSLRYEKHIMEHSFDLAGPYIHYGDYRYLNEIKAESLNYTKSIFNQIGKIKDVRKRQIVF